MQRPHTVKSDKKEEVTHYPFNQRLHKTASETPFCLGFAIATLEKAAKRQSIDPATIPVSHMKEKQKAAHSDYYEEPSERAHSLAGITSPTETKLVTASTLDSTLSNAGTAILEAKLTRGHHAFVFGKLTHEKCFGGEANKGITVGPCTLVRKLMQQSLMSAVGAQGHVKVILTPTQKRS